MVSGGRYDHYSLTGAVMALEWPVDDNSQRARSNWTNAPYAMLFLQAQRANVTSARGWFASCCFGAHAAQPACRGRQMGTRRAALDHWSAKIPHRRGAVGLLVQTQPTLSRLPAWRGLHAGYSASLDAFENCVRSSRAGARGGDDLSNDVKDPTNPRCVGRG